MNIKELNEQRTKENQSYLDVALDLSRQQAQKLTFPQKLKKFQDKVDRARREEGSKAHQEAQAKLNGGSIRKAKEYSDWKALQKEKIVLVQNIRESEKKAEQLHKEYQQAQTLVTDISNGININSFSIDGLENAKQEAQAVFEKMDNEIKNYRALKSKLGDLYKNLKKAEKAVKILYANECAPLLKRLEKAMQEADQANEELKFLKNQVFDLQAPGFNQYQDYSHHAKTILQTGRNFLKSLVK